MMKPLRAAILYFLAVFTAGFALGVLRVLFVVKFLGERTAELIEQPIMLIVIVLAARRVIGRVQQPTPANCMAIGFIALILLVTLEFTVVLWVRGLNISDYIYNRDRLSGIAYLLMLAAFAMMPVIVARTYRTNRPGS